MSNDKLQRGDEVVVNVRGNDIISSFSHFDSQEVLPVIAVDGHGYYLFVPQYLSINDSAEVTLSFAKDLFIAVKFIGEQAVYVKPNNIVRVYRNVDGYVCNKCGELFPYSEPNQENGSLICWVCSNYPLYR